MPEPLRLAILPHITIILTAFALLTADSTVASALSSGPAETPQLTALRIDEEIRIDGMLTEAAWLRAPAANEFFQTQPREGEPATEKTEVRILYDNGSVYIGVHCFDREPDKIVAQKLQRDSDVEDDDMFAVILDTYFDRRNGYLFATNPNGVEEDGQIVDGAFSKNLDWDGVWEVRARIHDRGWTAEFRIPLWNLRFAGLASQTWGLNFSRLIKRKNEQVNWASWSRNNGGFFRVSRAGELNNLVGLKPGFNLQIKPFSLGKVARSELLSTNPQRADKLDVGFDAKYGISSNLILDLTANTDFAQVEADVDQINLTRFPLFFPEKREFFLESASLFNFGQRGFFGPPPFLLFFSRRIGIEGFDTIVPILAGGRLTGKVGKTNIGLLDIVTDEKAGFAKSHFTVARASRDVFQRSRIGGIFTNRADFGGRHQQAVGVDANIWFNNELEFQTFAAQTHENNGNADRRAWKTALDYTRDHWGWFASMMQIEQGFDPAVGFVLRQDIRLSTLAFRVSPQPNGRVLRRTDIRQNFQHVTDASGELQDWDYGLTFFNELASADEFSFGYAHEFIRLHQPYSFRPALRIPIGDYSMNRVNATFNSSTKRRWTASAYVQYGDFYSGDIVSYGAGGGLLPNPHIAFFAQYSRNHVDLTQGSLSTDLFEFRANLSLSTQLFVNALLQYNSESNDFSSNIRLNFIHSPGSDLFIVFNERRGRFGESLGDGLPARNREIILKLTRLFRI